MQKKESDRFKVDFVIVGAQKCGTTTLTNMLRTHPSIVCCDQKEPHFFSTCEDWRTELSEYEKLFRRGAGKIYFEASTTYTFYPHFNLEVWESMYDYNSEMKIIYIVRDPIQRIISGYMHAYERGYTDRSLERAIVKEASLLDITRYASQITPFIDRFGRDKVKILFFDDLIRDPRSLLNDLSDFLGVSASEFGDIRSIHSNKSLGSTVLHHKYRKPNIIQRGIRKFMPAVWRRMTDNRHRAFDNKPTLSPPLRRMVSHLLRAEIDELEDLTGRDLRSWREESTHTGKAK